MIARMGTGAAQRRSGAWTSYGKTGTTNDDVDAWFAGYQPGLVGRCVDGVRPAQVARRQRDRRRGGLPIWMGFMRTAP